MNDPYVFGHHPDEHRKRRRRRRNIRLFLIIGVPAALVIAVIIFLNNLKPNTKITGAEAVTKKVSFDDKLRHFDEANFSIDLPSTWVPIPRPTGAYQTFTYRHSEKGSNAAQLEIFQDTIPVNYAVNRVMIVNAAASQLELKGPVSDNCAKFTKGLTPALGQTGVPAKWLDINFLCDQFNRERDVIGTSSPDGVNTVTLVSPSSGRQHKFFFAYSNQDITPDYTVFQNALNSFRMK